MAAGSVAFEQFGDAVAAAIVRNIVGNQIMHSFGSAPAGLADTVGGVVVWIGGNGVAKVFDLLREPVPAGCGGGLGAVIHAAGEVLQKALASGVVEKAAAIAIFKVSIAVHGLGVNAPNDDAIDDRRAEFFDQI